MIAPTKPFRPIRKPGVVEDRRDRADQEPENAQSSAASANVSAPAKLGEMPTSRAPSG